MKSAFSISNACQYHTTCQYHTNSVFIWTGIELSHVVSESFARQTLDFSEKRLSGTFAA